MVFEGRIVDMLQAQASRFIRGFKSEQLRLGLLSGSLELRGLALNPDPLDELCMDAEIPFVVKAGALLSAVAQVSLLQGELELTVDGLVLLLAPTHQCLTRDEVHDHRVAEVRRMEFVHMRSQCQRKTLERDMFRQLFSDYLSRLKLTVRNVHIRVEVDGEAVPWNPGAMAAFGLSLASCAVTPLKGLCNHAAEQGAQGELLLAERADVQALSLYFEAPGAAREHIPRSAYEATKPHPLGAFGYVKQEIFLSLMAASVQAHASMPQSNQLMPAASAAVAIDLRAQPLTEGLSADGCLTMEISVRLEGGPSRLNLGLPALEHAQWLARRILDYQLWQYLHASTSWPNRGSGRWRLLQHFLALRRRVQGNRHTLREAIQMRMDCKEYVKLYKRKFNGPARSMVPPSARDAKRLVDIELLYPPDKLINFRLMAYAELKTEMALSHHLNSDDGGATEHNGHHRRIARELTPLEQIHLHGHLGYGVNIYRGIPPPPSSLKIRVDLQAPEGLWWVVSGARVDADTWAVAVDSVTQPVRLVLADSLSDGCLFATLEVPVCTEERERPLALLLGRSAAAFDNGSPGRGGSDSDARFGGEGGSEWCAVLELHGSVYVCCQAKTVLASSANSPWDIYAHLSCGETVADAAAAQTVSHAMAPAAAGDCIFGDRLEGNSAAVPASLRLRLPLALPSGQPGPLSELLRCSLAAAMAPGVGSSNEILAGAAHSAIASLARHLRVTRALAKVRFHLRLPEVRFEALVGDGVLLRLPPFDAAVHLEADGLMDGFVVGLHHLQHFATSFLHSSAPVPPTATPAGARRWNGCTRASSGTTPWPLHPLEQAPPLQLIAIGALAACAAALGNAQTPAMARDTSISSQGAALHTLLSTYGLASNLTAGRDSPAASVTLLLVLVAVVVGRRLLWDARSSAGSAAASQGDAPKATTTEAAARSIGQVYSFFGAAMHAALLIGFPLHPRCLELAVWAGAHEIIEAAATAQPKASPWPPTGLIALAARGALVNLPERQEEVVRWLLRQGAQIDESDDNGRTLLDWACWAGAQELVSMALRAGQRPCLATSRTRSPPSRPPASPHASPAASMSSGLASALASPLAHAVAGRSREAVAMLLRASGDPHAPPSGAGVGALLLAVRNCEYEIACELLIGAACVNVKAALDPTTSSSAPSLRLKEALGCDVGEAQARATAVLAESLRRFMGIVSRLAAELAAERIQRHRSSQMLAVGAHPDEALLSSARMHFEDICHPVLLQLSPPVHKVSQDQWPGTPPHRWLRQSECDAWAPVTRFVELCVAAGFSPDNFVLSRTLSALPTEARRAIQHALGLEVEDDSPPPNSASDSDEDTLGDVPDDEHRQQVSRSLVESAKPPHDTCRNVAGAQGVMHKSPHRSSLAQIRAGSAWDVIALRAVLASRPLQTSPLPTVRVLVTGSPRVGKTSVARRLLKALRPASDTFDRYESNVLAGERTADPAWIQVSSGCWLREGQECAEVCVWDGPAAPLPGLHSRLMADPSVPLLFVVVVDAAVDSESLAEDLVAACAREASTSSKALKRVLVVENVFSQQPILASALRGGRAACCHVARCNVKSLDDDLAAEPALLNPFFEALNELTAGLSGREPVGIPAPAPLGATEPWSAALHKLPFCAPRAAGGPEAATCVAGDSALVDPSALAWSWAAVRSARGSFATAAPWNLGGALVPYEQLEVVLASASAGEARPSSGCEGGGAEASGVLFRALADVGLICPVPCFTEHAAALGCREVLVPDFASRLRITPAVARCVASFDSKEGVADDQTKAGHDGVAAPGVSARLVWNIEAGVPPELRTILRNFLARGVEGGASCGGGGKSSAPRSIAIKRFALLETGPTGAPGSAAPDSLSPGFLLTFAFDLAEAEAQHVTAASKLEEVARPRAPPLSGGRPPPSGMQALRAPSGEARRHGANGDASRTFDVDDTVVDLLDGLDAESGGLTTVVVGTSCRGSSGGGADDDAPIWDIYCAGLHAQWAWRALLGTGACSSPGFAGFRKDFRDVGKAGVDSLRGTAAERWPMQPPTCILSTAPQAFCAEELPTEAELASFSWLLNGPLAANLRAALVSQAQPPPERGLASCCLRLCGKKASAERLAKPSLGGTRSPGHLGAHPGFDAFLLARDWSSAPRLLDDALARDFSTWFFCAVALARAVHDAAAAVAGPHGRALPLLCAVDGKQALQAVALVTEGPGPLMAAGHVLPHNPASLGAIRPTSGLHAWLKMCRPAALWSAAGGARGYVHPGAFVTPSFAEDRGGSPKGAQVVEALRAAFDVELTEQMVAELWGALGDLDASRGLVRRASGTWAQVSAERGVLL